MYMWKYIQDCHSTSSIQTEDSFYQQIGLKFKEETIRVHHLEQSFVWCWNLDALERISEIPGKFWSVMLAEIFVYLFIYLPFQYKSFYVSVTLRWHVKSEMAY
jgi:hypothetical protein